MEDMHPQADASAVLTARDRERCRASAEPLVERWWFNALWFQLTWFSAVLGREALLPVTAGMLLLHLVLVTDTRLELRYLAWVAVPGMTVDTLLSVLGIFQFAGNVLLPLWLCLLWLAFATTLRRSLAFLGSHPGVAMVAGAVAPLNYLAGERLGAVDFALGPWVTFALLVPLWAALVPSLCLLTERLCRKPPAPHGEDA